MIRFQTKKLMKLKLKMKQDNKIHKLIIQEFWIKWLILVENKMFIKILVKLLTNFYQDLKICFNNIIIEQQ